jgi:hypothetical protein
VFPQVPELDIIAVLAGALRQRLKELRSHPQAGYTTETVLITAFLAGIALLLATTLGPKLVAKINSISF